MKLRDFDYHLPIEMIAQQPVHQRDRSKLLVLDLKKDEIKHKEFYQITEFLKPGDTIVLNDTRVVPARLLGHKPTGGKVELLILNPYATNQYLPNDQTGFECLIKGRVRAGDHINLDTGEPGATQKAHVIEQLEGGRFRIEFDPTIDHLDIISQHGIIPLPPYIKSELPDTERYQTIYSKVSGSIAAPTAGLHFTQNLMDSLTKMDVKIAYITLHISYGTFTPVRKEDISQHSMYSEYAILTGENADKINAARNSRTGRLVAVGTTTVRTLESIAGLSTNRNRIGPVQDLDPWEGWTDLFIYPGYTFKAGIDILITNFHLPKSTLIMLVSAFAGRDNILKAYREAIAKNYRFYSLGDSMMIIK